MRRTYYNKKQLEFLKAKQKICMLIWGRGTGKTSCGSGINYMRATQLPRAKTFFSAITYKQILTKSMPAIEGKWMEWGLIDGIHYVVGQRPPKFFDKPYAPPRSYENIITFKNGFTMEFLSMDRSDLARGGSYDGGDVDEAALVKDEDVKIVLIPSIRGNLHRFGSHYLHQRLNFYTSVAWKPEGKWIYEHEELAKLYPNDYFFSEANVYDNIHILGEEGIKRMQESMSFIQFNVECLNQRIAKIVDGFYSKFDQKIHGYMPEYDYTTGNRGIELEGEKQKYYRRDQIIEASFDFSGWFNCSTIWQEDVHNAIERCINQFWVKGDKKIGDLVDEICNHYSAHQMKFIRIWGEPRGHDKKADTKLTIYQQIENRFREHGWDVEIMVKAGRTTHHVDRYEFINTLLEESNPLLPKIRMNLEECKDTIISLETTDINNDFKKDKSKEKIRSFPQEHAPHLTDTVDYYLYPKHAWRLQDDDYGMGMGVSII